jgi:type II secretory pathway component PulJ
MEVVLSTVIVSIILGATVSVLMITQRGIAGSTTVVQDAADGRDAAELVTMDLSLAQSFSERTGKAVTFTVPDRDGDGQPETIRYSWSGTSGDPLTRQSNGGTVVTLAENVTRFDLDYLLKSLGEPGTVESDDGNGNGNGHHGGH